MLYFFIYSKITGWTWLYQNNPIGNVTKTVVPDGATSITVGAYEHVFYFRPDVTNYGYQFGIFSNDTNSTVTVPVSPGWILRKCTVSGSNLSYLSFQINNAPIVTVTDTSASNSGDLKFTRFYLSETFDTSIFN